jgi:malate synthase
VLGDRPHQKERLREDVNVAASQLIDFTIQGGQITEAGLRLNLNVALQYIESWLRGTGAVAIYNLMEDAATAEISRAQVWQWINSPNGVLSDGRDVTREMVHAMLPEEIDNIRALYGEANFAASKIPQAAQVFERVVTEQEFIDFLTLVAYEYLP